MWWLIGSLMIVGLTCMGFAAHYETKKMKKQKWTFGIIGIICILIAICIAVPIIFIPSED